MALSHIYQITYTMQDNSQSEPYLLVQDDAQAVGVNKALYADGLLVDGALANKYHFRRLYPACRGERMYSVSCISGHGIWDISVEIWKS